MMPNIPSLLSPHRAVLLTVALIAAALGVIVIITPAAIFPDASWGFQVMRSMELGGPFNTLIKPSQENIALNTGEFISWWSPGQYLLPYLFKNILNLNTGQAASLTTCVCQILGLTGFYAFFKKAGFSPTIRSLSLLIIICQQAFFLPYIFYIGGETLLFAFAGWFLYGCLTFEKLGWKLLLFILLSGWVGFICKSSFIWIYAAGLLWIWIHLSYENRSVKAWLFKGCCLGIPAMLSIVVIYWIYLSRGLNPSSTSNGFDLSLKTFTFPLASPILSGFSADDLVNGFIYHNDDALLSAGWAAIILVGLAILSVILVYKIFTKVPHKDYCNILIIFYVVALLFFGSAFIRKLDISYEARHFRIIGILIIPGVLCLLDRVKLVYRLLFGIFVAAIAIFSGIFYFSGLYGLNNYTAYGTSGIGQQFIDQESLNYVKLLEDKHRNATFVFFSPDLGLEVQHNRFITLDALNADINIDFDQYIHKGHAGPLFIIMPSKYIGIRASVILKSFPGYKGFSLKEISDNYVLYFATEPR